jgi:hypothetical protein
VFKKKHVWYTPFYPNPRYTLLSKSTLPTEAEAGEKTGGDDQNPGNLDSSPGSIDLEQRGVYLMLVHCFKPHVHIGGTLTVDDFVRIFPLFL